MKSSLGVCCVTTVTATVYLSIREYTTVLQCSVLHPVLVNIEIMEDFRAAGCGAGQQAFMFISHQPLAALSSHVAGHVLFGPGVQPGLKASVQACVDPLLGLKETLTRTTQISY